MYNLEHEQNFSTQLPSFQMHFIKSRCRFTQLILENWPFCKNQNNIFSLSVLFFKTNIFPRVKCLFQWPRRYSFMLTAVCLGQQNGPDPHLVFHLPQLSLSCSLSDVCLKHVNLKHMDILQFFVKSLCSPEILIIYSGDNSCRDNIFFCITRICCKYFDIFSHDSLQHRTDLPGFRESFKVHSKFLQWLGNFCLMSMSTF